MRSIQDITPPTGVTEVLKNLLMNIVANPVDSLVNANYIGILSWAIILGIALKSASDGTKNALENISDAIATAVKWIINCAPFGIMGLIFTTISEQGLDVLLGYGRLICVLVGTMLFVALIMNPLITFICFVRPIPTCASLPERQRTDSILHPKLCCQHSGQHETLPGSWFGRGYLLHLHSTWRNYQYGRSCYYISTMALAAAHTLDIHVDFPTALILCVLSAASAAGASGVAGGSLLLIPLACSLFGIPTMLLCKSLVSDSSLELSGFLRNRTELIYRCPLYGNRRYAYTEITMRNSFASFSSYRGSRQGLVQARTWLVARVNELGTSI